MTKPPRHKVGGFCNVSALPKGPEGRALCRQCGTEVPKDRRTFCSQRCVDDWKVRTGNGLDRIVKARDHGICAVCSLDCEELKKRRRATHGSARQEFDTQHCIPAGRTRLWDIDHINPVVHGGGSCGLENLRTLCIPCHKRVTRELAGQRAEARRTAVE
jgi:5-methylcytosine-specific restriction protein A